MRIIELFTIPFSFKKLPGLYIKDKFLCALKSNSNYYIFFALLVFTGHFANGQCLLPSSQADTLFPVTNVHNTLYSPSGGFAYSTGANVFNVASSGGKYYLLGNFKNLSTNQGPGLIIDTATNTIITPQKWQIDGNVTIAIPDGQGGFFISGNFSNIGDSARKFIARIDGAGRPNSWNPKVDRPVNAMQIRNDTLFIAGEFSMFMGASKPMLALYSISGDSVLRTRFNAPLSEIKSFLLNKDTLIFGGDGGEIRIGKFNFRNGINIPFQLQFTEFGTVNHMQFNEDSSIVIYRSEGDGEKIKAFRKTTGILQYEIVLEMSRTPPSFADVFGIKVVGSKAYAVGYFEHVLSKTSTYNRKGFFAFNATTGTILDDDLHSDGYPTYLNSYDGKLFLSGNFSSVSSVSRLNFAVIDTGSLAVQSYQISPTDEITSLAFYKGTAFVGGYFNGINAVARNGFAAIDSASKALLPWAPSNTNITEGKRMVIKGDTLFVLGIINRPNSCMVNDFNTSFVMVRLSDGQRLPLTIPGMTDFIIDSGYLYAAVDKQIRRYSLPTLTRDLNWGINFTGSGGDHTPVYLLTRGDKIYSIGDNRFNDVCTTLPDRKGWFIIYNKSTGIPEKYYSYQGERPTYDIITFDHALLTENRLYIQGFFKKLNGRERRNFACINIDNGAITDWETSFSKTTINSSFQRSSDLKLYQGKIWFGSAAFNDQKGHIFPGFGAIDTTSGKMLPSLMNMNYINTVFTSYSKSGGFQDFIISDNNFVGAGGFDYISGKRVSSIASMQMLSGTAPGAGAGSIEGPGSININSTLNKFYLTTSNTNLLGYTWSYSGTGIIIRNNGEDSVWLEAGPLATGGNLIVKAVHYCSEATIAMKSISVTIPPPTPVITGINNKCSVVQPAYGKLSNPPVDANIEITLDGIPVSYTNSDSSFQYFTSNITTGGTHRIRVKYNGPTGSSEKDTSYFVTTARVPQVIIAGPGLVICSGTSLTLSAIPTNGGSAPSYQWQLNGVNAGTGSVYTSTQFANNDQIKVIMNSNETCITTSVATSPTATIRINSAVDPVITISGNTVLNTGQVANLVSMITNAAPGPIYQWQDSTSSAGWKNIAGVGNSATLNYTPSQSGDKVRCRLTTSSSCANPHVVYSESIVFKINTVTGLPSEPVSEFGIRYFPNPVRTNLIIDNLRISEGWEEIVISGMDGKQHEIISIRHKETVIVPVHKLALGIYVISLRRKAGSPAYFRFAKL